MIHSIVCYVPKQPKVIHPMRAVRVALKKSQSEFGRMFGLSGSYVQAIELNHRPLCDGLADAIMLRFGIDRDSLQRPRKPRSLIGSTKAAYIVSTIDLETRATPDGLANTSDEYRATCAISSHNEKLARSIA